MNRIAGSASVVIVNSASKDFRTKPTMNKPFLIPHSLQRRSGDGAEYTRHVRITQRSKSNVCARLVVRISGIKRRVQRAENEERIEIGLEEDIDVYPLAQVTSVANVASHGIKRIGSGGRPILHSQPRVVVRHEIQP